jgi:hypothetical protein
MWHGQMNERGNFMTSPEQADEWDTFKAWVPAHWDRATTACAWSTWQERARLAAVARHPQPPDVHLAQAQGHAPADERSLRALAGFNLTPEKLQQLLDGCLKPDEIAGPADVQLERVEELLHWFARYTQRQANPKWLASHACELAYYIATLASNRFIDLREIKQKAFMEGVNTTDEDRAMLKRLQAK